MALTRKRSTQSSGGGKSAPSDARIKKGALTSKSAVKSVAGKASKEERQLKASKDGVAAARKARARLGEMAEIITRVSKWAGGPDRALAWYRAQPISAFGDRTAESLVNSGQAAALRDYLDSIAVGGFA